MDNEDQNIDAAIDAAEAQVAEETADTTATPSTGADTPSAEAKDDAPADGGGEAADDAADTPAEGSGEGGEAKGDGEEKPKMFMPSDAQIERAIRSGLSLLDTMSIGSNEALETILSRLEGTPSGKTDKAGAAGDDDSAGAGKGEGADDPLAGIPELSADDGYDEDLVAAFNGLRRLAMQQSETIRQLAEAGATAKAQDRFTQLVGTLDESVRNGMDDSSRAALKKQYDVLAAGYKALNAEKKDTDIFAEAAKLALGDRVAQATAFKKAEALERRKGLALAKPGGEGGAGRRRGAVSDDDPAAAAAAEIRAELGL